MDIFVRNLSRDVEEADLRELFEAYGRVLKVTLIQDKQSGRRMGFGFVRMASKEEGVSAINGLKGAKLKGKALEFQDSRTRFERRQLPDRRTKRRPAPDRRRGERRNCS